MIRNAFAAALVIYVVLVGLVLNDCLFLAPIRGLIWARHAERLIWMSLLLVLNVLAGVYAILRKFALKDTGDKLSHLEKQLRGRASISEELTERIFENK